MKTVGYIQFIGAKCSEGMIIIDPGQSIVWANPAALAMHCVDEVRDLGDTIDEYHARFQVKYVAVLPQAAGDVGNSTGDDRGRSQPDVLMEMKPQQEAMRSSAFLMRKMVLFDDNRRPAWIVIIMHKTLESRSGADRFSDLLHMFRDPAAIVRPEDGSVVAANAAYLAQVAGDGMAGGREGENWQSTVELDGEILTLLQCSPATGDTVQGQSGRPMQGAARALAQFDGVAMHALDEDMRIAVVSQTWLDWLGYTRENVIGRSIFEFMAAAAAESFERHCRAQLAGASTLRDQPADFRTRNGDVVNALVSAATAHGDPHQRSLLVSICVDVTGHKRLEDTVAATIAIAPVPMLVRKCDDGRIMEANDAFLKATGYAVTDLVGHSFDEFGNFESKKRKEEFEQAVKVTGRSDAVDVTLKTQQGDTLDCALTATKVWMFGKPCQLLVLQDFTERRRTELELMSALEAVMTDGSWFSRSIVERLAALRAPAKSGRQAAALSDLTPRERDVLSLISLGLPDSEISERLGLTRSTIRNHLSTLYSKINVKNRGSAIIWARDRCINVTQLPLRPKAVHAKFATAGVTQSQIVPTTQATRVRPDVKTATLK